MTRRPETSTPRPAAPTRRRAPTSPRSRTGVEAVSSVDAAIASAYRRPLRPSARRTASTATTAGDAARPVVVEHRVAGRPRGLRRGAQPFVSSDQFTTTHSCHFVHAGYCLYMQRVIGILVGVLILFWIISAPTSAAGTVNNILDGLAAAADSVILFVRNLFA